MSLKMKYTLLAAFIVVAMVSFANAQEVVKISKDDLKQKLAQPDVVILDARSERDWASSQWKIQGAARVEPSRVDDWKDKYSRDKTIVLYCA